MISVSSCRPPLTFGREPLADDVAQSVGQADAQLLFFAEREETENTVDRLAGIDRVQRAENEVAGFRRHQARLPPWRGRAFRRRE